MPILFIDLTGYPMNAVNNICLFCFFFEEVIDHTWLAEHVIQSSRCVSGTIFTVLYRVISQVVSSHRGYAYRQSVAFRHIPSHRWTEMPGMVCALHRLPTNCSFCKIIRQSVHAVIFVVDSPSYLGNLITTMGAGGIPDHKTMKTFAKLWRSRRCRNIRFYLKR